MKILAIEKETPGKAAPDFEPHLRREAAQAWGLYRAGVIRELYFNAETHCSVLMLECSSLAEAAAALDTLPLVREGLITFELLPLAPYDGFERLFPTEQSGVEGGADV